MMRVLLSTCLVLFLALTSPGTSATHEVSVKSPELARLYELISHRLSFMEDVAAWKWANDKPIEDLEREKVVLDKASDHADLMGLDSDSVRAFLQAQMDAAKFVQQQAFDKWQAGSPPPGNPKDLASVLRPAISQTGDRILLQIGLVLPHLADISPEDLQPYLGLPDHHIAALTEGLQQIRNRAPGQRTVRQIRSLAHVPGMHRITAQKVLTVGTTGDYAPFSSGTDGDYSGIDIDLAHALAKALDVELVFVQTSWPTLLDD